MSKKSWCTKTTGEGVVTTFGFLVFSSQTFGPNGLSCALQLLGMDGGGAGLVSGDCNSQGLLWSKSRCWRDRRMLQKILTDNLERAVENDIMQKGHQNRKWIYGLCQLLPTWIRQLCLSYCRDLLCLQRKDHQIPLNF